MPRLMIRTHSASYSPQISRWETVQHPSIDSNHVGKEQHRNLRTLGLGSFLSGCFLNFLRLSVEARRKREALRCGRIVFTTPTQTSDFALTALSAAMPPSSQPRMLQAASMTALRKLAKGIFALLNVGNGPASSKLTHSANSVLCLLHCPIRARCLPNIFDLQVTYFLC